MSGPVAARGHNLGGDEQADKVHHGGPDQAVYEMTLDDGAWTLLRDDVGRWEEDFDLVYRRSVAP